MTDTATSIAEERAAMQRAEKRQMRRRRSAILPLLLDLVEQTAQAAGKRPFYVQVGAHDGVLGDPLCDRTIAHRWSGLLLEPSAIYYDQLCALYPDRPDMIIRNLGVSAKKEKLTLFRVDEAHRAAYPFSIAGCASLNRKLLLDHMMRHSAEADAHICTETVQLDPLRTVLRREKITRIDMLIVDVEGHEIEVFDSFDLSKAAPRLIWYEHKHLARQANRALMSRFLDEGYKPARVGQDTAVLHPSLATEGVVTTLVELGATLAKP
ncbi:FkbM family methyltransferase [Gymnodinialimonas sp. 2305UL16-5]|uniref:FkbM family methyltransferase n=1 Tax=Gymnodinialimonas mytili TaxID=3126503 RepID=UPI0030B5B37F